ncbi:iron chaperone [Dyadobacter sp. 32]|uniref:iron chaperone n=1 Tax=Dyadobacter sp. 32 TaxID=538966 RepID=UPI0039C6F4F2
MFLIEFIHFRNIEKIEEQFMDKSEEVDNYIASFPAETREVLELMRSTIKEAAPEAVEIMNYGIPTLTLHGNLVHFGGFKKHVGFYPAPSGIKAFQEELSVYKGAKGSIQFPLEQPLPLDLIKRIVKFRVEENVANCLTVPKK